MYKNNYVLTIRRNNQTLPETNGECLLPFQSEYEVRLRNKNRKRSLVDLYIDGRLVTKGGLIVDANSYVDLERFIDSDLTRGDRFKFVPISDDRIDKGESQNGLVEARFYDERERKFEILNTSWSHTCHYQNCWQCGTWHCSCQYCPIRNYTINSGGTSGNAIYSSNVAIYNSTDISQCSTAHPTSSVLRGEASAGGTVRGGTSSQRFTASYLDVDKEKPTVIRLKLLGVPPQGHECKGKIISYCTRCGQETGQEDRYCSKCGKDLTRR